MKGKLSLFKVIIVILLLLILAGGGYVYCYDTKGLDTEIKTESRQLSLPVPLSDEKVTAEFVNIEIVNFTFRKKSTLPCRSSSSGRKFVSSHGL